ncbi:DUF488 family protein, N3 subclade [Kroppenstedtia sanguinis]|uniref:DUF5348 domain-containing protein n=1 Tax=Kroppenstedtia sanguinis TaxID=1380684 RepID=A0ABW4CFC4_9BACL
MAPSDPASRRGPPDRGDPGRKVRALLYSSNFANLKKIRSPLFPVSIARGTPRWYKGRCYPDLMPEWEWLNATREEYDREFQKRLESLDPKRVIRELGENAVLLCWCKHNAGCHRRLVAEWLEETLTRWKYLQKPVVAEGFLRKNERGRYEIDDRFEFTSGQSIEVLISDPDFDETAWVKTRVEHNGQDYYLVGYDEIPMAGLMARERG